MNDDGDGRRDREKLIRAKERWARDGRLLTGETGDPARDRLPPGQRLVTDWPVLDLGVTPKFDPEKWRLRVDGLVERPLIVDWSGFLALPQRRIVTDIHCVTGWSRFDNAWEGVAALDILEAVRPKADARHCVFYGRDGYTTNVRLDRFAEEDVLLAHRWNGEMLSAAHGGPLRVVIPRWYFWKSAKWLRRIEICATDRPGYWEERGYHNDGDPWTEERYS